MHYRDIFPNYFIGNEIDITIFTFFSEKSTGENSENNFEVEK